MIEAAKKFAGPRATVQLRCLLRGYCLAVVAAQMALAVEELTSAELDVHDSRYPVLTTIACRKPL